MQARPGKKIVLCYLLASIIGVEADFFVQNALAMHLTSYIKCLQQSLIKSHAWRSLFLER